MIPQNYEVLLSKLRDKTVENKVNWSTTSDTDIFMVNFGDFSMTIWTGTDDEGDFVGFKLYDSAGKGVDSFWVYPSEGGFLMANELYSMARRKALRIDDAIINISKALESKDIIGE